VGSADEGVKVRNFAVAIACAVLLALPFVQPTIGRIDTWKIVLGIAGLMLFISAGMTRA
jgi:hypothetical protein